MELGGGGEQAGCDGLSVQPHTQKLVLCAAAGDDESDQLVVLCGPLRRPFLVPDTFAQAEVGAPPNAAAAGGQSRGWAAARGLPPCLSAHLLACWPACLNTSSSTAPPCPALPLLLGKESAALRKPIGYTGDITIAYRSTKVGAGQLPTAASR